MSSSSAADRANAALKAWLDPTTFDDEKDTLTLATKVSGYFSAVLGDKVIAQAAELMEETKDIGTVNDLTKIVQNSLDNSKYNSTNGHYLIMDSTTAEVDRISAGLIAAGVSQDLFKAYDTVDPTDPNHTAPRIWVATTDTLNKINQILTLDAQTKGGLTQNNQIGLNTDTSRHTNWLEYSSATIKAKQTMIDTVAGNMHR